MAPDRLVLNPVEGTFDNSNVTRLLQQLLEGKYISAAEKEVAEQKMSARVGLKEILDLKESIWTAASGRELWLGRMLLAGSSYEVIKNL